MPGQPGLPEGAPGGFSPDPNAPPGIPWFGPEQTAGKAAGDPSQTLFDLLKSMVEAKAAEAAGGGQQGQQGQQGQGPQSNPTAYSPGGGGREGGRGTKGVGPDGQTYKGGGVARTVEDYVNSGRQGHVTVAAVDGRDAKGNIIGGRNSFYNSAKGKEVNIERITYKGSDGKMHTEYNVPGVVHDSGPGENKGVGRHYDVATVSDKPSSWVQGTIIGTISDTGKTVEAATKGAQETAKAGIKEATQDAEKVAEKGPPVIGRGEPSLAYTKAFNEAVNSGKSVEESHRAGVDAAQAVQGKGKGVAELPPGATQFPGSENFKGNDATKNAQDYKGIIIHQTGKQTIEEQGKYQLTPDKNRQNAYYGYHYVIDRDGKIHAFGNPDTGRTNHMSGKTDRSDRLDLNNTNTIGIGFIGRDRTPEQTAAGKGLIDFLQGKYGIPKSEIFGHGELQGKDKERATLGPGNTPEGSQEAAGYRGAPTDVASPPGVPMPTSRPSDAPFDPGRAAGKGILDFISRRGDRGPDEITQEQTSPKGTTDPDKVGVPVAPVGPPGLLVQPGQTTAASPELSGPPHVSPDVGRPGATQFAPPGAEALGKGFLGPTLYDMLTQLVSPEVGRPGVETPQIGPPSFVGPTPASGRTGLNDMGVPNQPGILDVIQQAPSLPSIDPGGLQDAQRGPDVAAPPAVGPPAVAPQTIDLPTITNEKTAPTDLPTGREAPLVSETPGILGIIAEALGLDSGEIRQVKDLSRATGIPVETILAMAKKLADETGVSMDMALQIVMQSQTQMDQVGSFA
jgi:hypothetical protein